MPRPRLSDLRNVLSVMMPVFNEERTVGITLGLVLDRPEVREVIVVDDGSTDRSWEIISDLAVRDARVRTFRQPTNCGKGAALKLAIGQLTAPFALVQDADLEYDPDDYSALISPLSSGQADAVNGVRGFGGHTAYSYWFVKGNQWLTTVNNLMFNCYLADLLSGYKALRSELWRRLDLQSVGFEVEAEVVAKVMRLGYRFHEVPVSYITRSREEGKKIRPFDGLRILATLLRVRISSEKHLFGPQVDGEYHRRRRVELASRHPLVGRTRRTAEGAPQEDSPC